MATPHEGSDASGEPASPFPWSLGVYDAHCHPTTIMASTRKLSGMSTTAAVALATRTQDQGLVEGLARERPLRPEGAVDDDGDAQKGCCIVPGFGWHPWYSHWLINDMDGNGRVKDDHKLLDKETHYVGILQPHPKPLELQEDREFLDDLPEPTRLSTALEKMRQRLSAFPHALIGEIGIDTSARLPEPFSEQNPGRAIESCDCARTEGARNGRRLSKFRVQHSHQRTILAAQLKLAGEMKRAVSIHSVGTHGSVLEVLMELWKGYEKKSKRKTKQAKAEERHIGLPGYFKDEFTGDDHSEPEPPGPFPPRICMHSYSGPLEQLTRYLHYSVPADIYFSFSVAVNYMSDSKRPSKTSNASRVRTVPDDRILVETDLNRAGEDLDQSLEDVVRKVCQEKEWKLEDGVRILGENWRRFIFG